MSITYYNRFNILSNLLKGITKSSLIFRAEELMTHSFLSNIDWELAKRQRLEPPLIPPQGEVNAADAFEIGAFDEEDTQGIRVRKIYQKISERFS